MCSKRPNELSRRSKAGKRPTTSLRRCRSRLSSRLEWMKGASSVACAGIPCLPLGVWTRRRSPMTGSARANGNDERGRARRRPLVAVHPQLAFEVQLGDVECDRAARACGECQSLRVEREVVGPVDRDLLRLVDLEAGDGPDLQGRLVLARRLDVLRAGTACLTRSPRKAIGIETTSPSCSICRTSNQASWTYPFSRSSDSASVAVEPSRQGAFSFQPPVAPLYVPAEQRERRLREDLQVEPEGAVLHVPDVQLDPLVPGSRRGRAPAPSR